MLPDFTTTALVVTLLITAIVGDRQPGGADHVHEAAFGGDCDIGDGRGRHGEIQNAVGVGRQFPQVG